MGGRIDDRDPQFVILVKPWDTRKNRTGGIVNAVVHYCQWQGCPTKTNPKRECSKDHNYYKYAYNPPTLTRIRLKE